MILDRTKIGISLLHVQSVLVYHVIVQYPVGRSVCALGITDGELYFLDRSGQGDGWKQVVVGTALVALTQSADIVVGRYMLIAQTSLHAEAP